VARNIHHAKAVELMDGVCFQRVGGSDDFAALGIRYPLQMLPLLLFELVWEVDMVIAFALPLWSAIK